MAPSLIVCGAWLCARKHSTRSDLLQLSKMFIILQFIQIVWQRLSFDSFLKFIEARGQNSSWMVSWPDSEI